MSEFVLFLSDDVTLKQVLKVLIEVKTLEHKSPNT